MLRFYRNLYEPKELDVLSDSQRRYVHRECIHPMTIRLPFMFAKSGFWVVIILLAVQFGAFDSTVGIILSLLVFFTVDEGFRLLLLRRNRDKVAAFVREHADEIKAAAHGG